MVWSSTKWCPEKSPSSSTQKPPFRHCTMSQIDAPTDTHRETNRTNLVDSISIVDQQWIAGNLMRGNLSIKSEQVWSQKGFVERRMKFKSTFSIYSQIVTCFTYINVFKRWLCHQGDWRARKFSYLLYVRRRVGVGFDFLNTQLLNSSTWALSSY